MKFTPGDFNGDKKADLIVTTSTGSVFSYSTGTGTWNNAQTNTDWKLGTVLHSVGNYDGDTGGKKDLIVTTNSNSTWKFSDGTANWTDSYIRADLRL